MSRGDTAKKNILESERVCDRHFVSGKPAATWHKHKIDWVPTLNLGKMEFKGDEQKDQKQKASEERAERAKERRKRTIERQELEVAQKRKHLNVSGDRIVDLHFTEAKTSTSTEDVEEETGLAIANTPEMELAEPSCSTIVVLQAMLKTKLKKASQSLQKTPKYRPRSSPTCFTDQLIKLRTDNISERIPQVATNGSS